MIPINELRYGSWVAFEDRQVMVSSFEGTGSQLIGMEHPEFNCTWTTEIEGISPIPLTPEVLEKCEGFHKQYDGSYEFQTEDRWIEVNNPAHPNSIMVGGWMDDNESMAILHFTVLAESLHQLQDLVKILTGKELTYNP